MSISWLEMKFVEVSYFERWTFYVVWIYKKKKNNEAVLNHVKRKKEAFNFLNTKWFAYFGIAVV